MNLSFVKWIRGYIKPYAFWFILAVVAVISVSIINVINVHFIKLMTDAALAENWHQTFKIALGIIPIILLGFLAEYTFKYFSSVFSGGLTRDMKREVVDHVLQLPIKKLESVHSGEFISRMTNDLNLVHQFFNNTFPRLLSQPFIFMGAFVYLLTVHWLLAVFSIILMPIVTSMINKISKRIEKSSEEVQIREGQANTIVKETITGMPIIKAFQLNQTYYRKYEREVTGILDEKRHIAKRSFVMNCLITILYNIPYLVIFLFGGYLTLETKMSPGDLVAFILLMNYLSGPIGEIPNLLTQFRSSIPGFKRVYELFTYPKEALDKEGEIVPSSFTSDRTAIRLHDVSFSYNSETSILKNMSFTIKEGEVIAIVGLSGAGKSTIIDLLTALYPFQSGNVYVQNRHLHEWELADLRQQYAVVSQDIHLFPGTIAENILCGNLKATKGDIEAAAQDAYAHEFIMEFPDGYQTIIGESRVTLSGGQRQRIAIARAILKDAPILLLDEATSSLDTRTEMNIQQTLARVMKGRTTLIIAHRLSTIQQADRIMVLEGGAIIENAPHDVLIKQSGVYRRLFHQQFNIG